MKILQLNPADNLSEIINETDSSTFLEVSLAKGVYRQKVRILRGNLHLIGDPRGEVLITFSDYNDLIHSDGLPFNTFRTPTMSIFGDSVTIDNISIKNESGRGPEINQAIALSLYGNKIILNDCHLSGFQDTLFCGPLPKDLIVRYQDFLQKEELVGKKTTHVFNRCIIDGDVDFIFGSSTAIFNDCTINVLNKGYIAAPSTYEETKYGFVFYKCRIINHSDEPVYLARPWREFGSTIFLECKFLGNFHKERYHPWEKTHTRFHEFPFVDCSMSSPLIGEELEQLMGVINCSIGVRNQNT